MSTKILALSAVPKRPTIEDIKKLESFKHFTDEQAEEFLQTIRTLCDIVLGISLRQQQKEAEEKQAGQLAE